MTEEDRNCSENMELGAKVLPEADRFDSSEGVKLQWDFCSALLIYMASVVNFLKGCLGREVLRINLLADISFLLRESTSLKECLNFCFW